jgi:hypothetical protein
MTHTNTKDTKVYSKGQLCGTRHQPSASGQRPAASGLDKLIAWIRQAYDQSA